MESSPTHEHARRNGRDLARARSGRAQQRDGDRKSLTEGEQAALALAEVLTVAPWKVTDEMVERCRKQFKDTEVAEIVHRTCNAAFFDRVTETARLPIEK